MALCDWSVGTGKLVQIGKQVTYNREKGKRIIMIIIKRALYLNFSPHTHRGLEFLLLTKKSLWLSMACYIQLNYLGDRWFRMFVSLVFFLPHT